MALADEIREYVKYYIYTARTRGQKQVTRRWGLNRNVRVQEGKVKLKVLYSLQKAYV